MAETDWYAALLDARRGIDAAMYAACKKAIRELPNEQRTALARYQMRVMMGESDD